MKTRARFFYSLMLMSILHVTCVAAQSVGTSAYKTPIGIAPAQPHWNASMIRAALLAPNLPTHQPMSSQPESGMFRYADDETVSSPVDTLDMSPLERIFWSRHGLMRLTGLFPLHEDNPTNDLRQIARVRRKMLSWHQTLGLVTVASMTATVIGGQRALNGHSGLHEASLPFTIGLYATTATLALASPPKLIPDRGGIDTITFHKAFAVLHLAGMIITPLLAPEADEGTWDRRHVHQAFGYATYAAFTGGMLTVMLFR